MKAVANLLGGSHLPLSGHMDRITPLPPSPSSMKTFLLSSSRHMERITHRSVNTLAALDDDNNNNHVSPPTPAGHDKSPLASFEVFYSESQEKFQGDWVLSRSDYECILQMKRKDDAERFRKRYTDGIVKEGCNNMKEQKTFIWPGNTSSWQETEESSGIMWVGMHGMDSICVVSKNEDMGATLLCHILGQMPIHEVTFNFRKSAIVEIEDLADLFPSCEVRETIYQMMKKRLGVEPPSDILGRFHKRIEKPFGVDAHKSREGGGHETTIAAFEQLFQKKFRSDEIKVSVLEPNYVRDSSKGDPSVQDLTDRQINEHLDVIHKTID